MDLAGEFPQHTGIGERSVADIAGQAMPFYEAVEVVVAVLRIQPARQLYCAQHPGLIAQPETAKLVLEETVVEAGVVGHQHFTFKPVIE